MKGVFGWGGKVRREKDIKNKVNLMYNSV